MASEEKKAKTSPAPKSEVASTKKDAGLPKDKSPAGKDKSPSAAEPSKAADAPKAEGGETAAASPSSYSRGEGQKPVSKAYKDNWNAIYAKKKKKR